MTLAAGLQKRATFHVSRNEPLCTISGASRLLRVVRLREKDRQKAGRSTSEWVVPIDAGWLSRGVCIFPAMMSLKPLMISFAITVVLVRLLRFFYGKNRNVSL